MNICSKFFILTLGLLCAGSNLFSAKHALPIEEVSIDNLLGEDEDLFSIDPANLRTFEDSFVDEETSIPFKDKVEMFLIILRSKTRGYHGGVVAHFEEHNNEYFLGSACIASMLLAALFKKYSSPLIFKTHA